MPLWISSISYAYFLLLLFKCLLQLLRHFLIVHEKKIFPFLRLTLKSSCSICTLFFWLILVWHFNCFVASPRWYGCCITYKTSFGRTTPTFWWSEQHQGIFEPLHFRTSAYCCWFGHLGGREGCFQQWPLLGWSQHHQLPTERLPWAPARAKAAPPPKPPVSSDHPPNAFLNWWSMFQVHQLRRDPSAYSLNISSPNTPVLNVESQQSDILGFWI